jgi:isopenicillin N synthase-like dioxygenase
MIRATQPPVIDIAEAERTHVHRAIDVACREWGVFQVVGHGIDLRLIAALRRQMRALFAAPGDQKRAIARTAKNPWGFYDRELTRHVRDWKQVYDFGPADGADMEPQWPAGLPAFEPIVRAFYEACDALALRLLRVITRNLGMPSESLDRHFRPAHTSFLRLNYYPRCPSPQWASRRACAHRLGCAHVAAAGSPGPRSRARWRLGHRAAARGRAGGEHRRHPAGVVERQIRGTAASRVRAPE